MNNAEVIADEILANTEGLKDVPIVPLPPKVKWGETFLAWDTEKKINYLTKFAEGMNHAADTIQNERDRLNDLCLKKDKLIESLKATADQNSSLLQQEIIKMNAERQDYHKAIQEADKKIKEQQKIIDEFEAKARRKEAKKKLRRGLKNGNNH